MAAPLHVTDESYEQVADDVLNLVASIMPMDLWMVTRRIGSAWVVLRVLDKSYGVHAEDVFCWEDSVCSRMIRGEGPMITGDIQEIPEYNSAPIARKAPIRAYCGVPVHRANGEMFGTLCGIHPEPLPNIGPDQLPMVRHCASLLTRVIEAQLKAQVEAWRADEAIHESQTDPLTKVANRRGLQAYLERVSSVTNLAEPVAVLSLDINKFKEINDEQGHAAGDTVLQTVAETLRWAVDHHDLVVRMGGDEFIVLLHASQLDRAQLVSRDITQRLAQRDISVSIGIANGYGFNQIDRLIHEADQHMYERKIVRCA